jgi:hypothetical protein
MSRVMNSELSLIKGLLNSSSALYSLSALTRKALRRVHLYILIANVSLIAAWLEFAPLHYFLHLLFPKPPPIG